MLVENEIILENGQGQDDLLDKSLIKEIDTGVAGYQLDYHTTRRCYMLRKKRDYFDKDNNPRTVWDIISYSTNIGYIVKLLAEDKTMAKNDKVTLNELVSEFINVKNSILKKFEESLK